MITCIYLFYRYWTKTNMDTCFLYSALFARDIIMCNVMYYNVIL